jgi:hypothetical protein
MKKKKNQLGTNNICQIGIDRWNWKKKKTSIKGSRTKK